MSARFGLRSLHLFTLQLGVMLEAGLSLSQSLEVLSRMGSATDAVAASMLADIDRGRYLSVAMWRAGVFSPAYLRLIKAGEATGRMHAVFGPLAENLERAVHQRDSLRSALAYPLLVLTVSSGMLAFLLYVQLPQLLRITASSQAAPPWLTRVVSLCLQPQLPALLGLLTALLALYLRALWRTHRGRAYLLDLSYRLPVVGPMRLRLALAAIAFDLSLMLRNGVDTRSTLRTLRDTPTGCLTLDRALEDLDADLQGGLSLSEALESRAVFPRILVLLCRSGEESGRLADALKRYSEITESEVHERVSDLTAILEPALLCFMGLVVGVVVLASLLPVYRLLLTV